MALNALADRYGPLEVSSVYESEAVGMTGANFLNLVVVLETSESLDSLSDWLKNLEDRHGRRRDGRDGGQLALDVDILSYDDLVGVFGEVRLPRAEILTNAFVLRPLAEVAGQDVHPPTGKTYAQLWKDYRHDQKLWKVSFTWRGEVISVADRSGEPVT